MQRDATPLEAICPNRTLFCRIRIGVAHLSGKREPPMIVLVRNEISVFMHRFLRPVQELFARFGPNIHITKVPSMVPRGAHYGAIQLASKRFVLHQSATNGHQTRHLLVLKKQTKTPTVLGFPSRYLVFYLAG